MILGAILVLWFLVYLGWNFVPKWWSARGEEKPKKPIKRPGLVLGCGMLIFFLAAQVFINIWFWSQASQLTGVNLTGIGIWEESLWNALGKASITEKARLPIGKSGSAEATPAPSWPPRLPAGANTSDLKAGRPLSRPVSPLPDGSYWILTEKEARIITVTVTKADPPGVGKTLVTAIDGGELELKVNAGSAMDAKGGTIWTKDDTAVLHTDGRAMLVKR